MDRISLLTITSSYKIDPNITEMVMQQNQRSKRISEFEPVKYKSPQKSQ